MEHELYIEINIEEEIKAPTTSEELDALFEHDTGRLVVDRHNVVFAVDGDTVPRNERYDPYIKYYPDCSSLNKVDRRSRVYRVYLTRPVYTDHNDSRGAITPKKMNKTDLDIMMKAFTMIVVSKVDKTKSLFLWEELKYMADTVMGSTLGHHELPIRFPNETDDDYDAKLQEEIERIKQETSMYKNITYDGKR